MSPKAIETSWRGYRFRSRTEARWAVAFTAAGEPFDYEREGYQLRSGWYLPDFWLPKRQLWLEVKGQEPNHRERSLARELAEATKRQVLIAIGPPDADTIYFEAMLPGDPTPVEVQFWLPDDAYRAARAERFDGKPPPPRSNQSRRWW